ncbi:uncharacterized protein [Argopecten irradians]|uniref:uncharacterized protein n=1 Tax=Argopecten irradians TaxID=31199 RepID=UPI00371CE211
MSKGRYIVTYYESADRKKPAVFCTTDDLSRAEKIFKENAERKIHSTVLYDRQKDKVVKIAIEGEPKQLSLAIELARGNNKNAPKSKINEEEAMQGLASLASALMGNSVPGLSYAVDAHFMGPYYAMKGDGVSAVKACAGMFGGLSGTVLGLLAGPVGAVAGGIAGAAIASEATGQLFKAFDHPDKCGKCKGTGLVEDYRTCKKCDGHGYTNNK